MNCCYCGRDISDNEAIVGAGTGDGQRFAHRHCHSAMEGEIAFIGATEQQQLQIDITRKYRQSLLNAGREGALNRTLEVAERVLGILSAECSRGYNSAQVARTKIQDGDYWIRDWLMVQENAVPG